MKIWRIRYSDRNGRVHSLYQEQDTKPTDTEALEIIHMQLSNCADGTLHGASRNFVLGIQINSVEEISLDDMVQDRLSLNG